MATKNQNILPDTEENSFLFALSTHEKAVKLVWTINRDTPLNFMRTEDFIIRRNQKTYHFIQYVFTDEVHEIQYILLKNQCDGAHLIPELKIIPYIIQVIYNESIPSKKIFSLMNKPEAGQLCFEIKPDQLKPGSRNLLNI